MARRSTRKIWLRLAGFIVLSVFIALLKLGFHFYSLFPNSVALYQWRYNWFDHLDFHTDQWTYAAGDEIAILGSDSEEDTLRLRVFDVLGRDSLFAERSVIGRDQAFRAAASVQGTQWQSLYQIKVQDDWPSGWMLVRLENEDFVRHQSIFIEPDTSLSPKPIALLLSTNTWNAYNHWGGQSLYSRNYTPTVSFQRPQPLSDPYLEDSYENHQTYLQCARKDVYLAELIDSLGYEFDAFPATYLQTHPELLQRYEVLTISTHSEYWSREMIEGLNAYLAQGGNFLSFSGNTAAYLSEYDPTAQQLTVHKDDGLSQWKNLDTTGLRSFGTEYIYMGFHTYAPYEVLIDTTWLLDGTQLKQGDLFGERSETYDYSVFYQGFGKGLSVLRRKGQYGAASGLEIDKVYPGTPENFVLVASGLNPELQGAGEVYPETEFAWSSQTGADLGYYEHTGGGLVFNTGSMAFTGAIPHDANIKQMIANLLERCTKK
ncbi:MAG: N,N-dimethylformamidase beta subunit family domain-containing protein [Bacteroidota bacterium]